MLNPADETLFESKSEPLTRKQARKVGLGSTDVEMAKGFKLQNAILLNDCG